MTLQSYHYAWLSIHQDRTEDWLRDKMAEGFDIHHVDGDHYNDAPSNLILIDALDHMRLHGANLNRLLRSGRKNDGLGIVAYELKTDQRSWSSIGRELFPKSVRPASLARGRAKDYAEGNGLPFPKPNSNMPPIGHPSRVRQKKVYT